MRDSASIPTSRRGLATSVRGVFYGWWLVGIASFMLTLMSLTVFQGVGTLLVALERQFGWSRTALSGAFALARAEGAVLGPIEGFLVDRVGTRRMTLIGYLIMAVGFVLQSQVNSLWQFYVAFIVIALGSGLGGWLAMIAMVNNWFNRRRSIAMASAMSGAHFGGLLVPLFAYCIEVFEFRAVSLGIGVFMLLIIGPVVKVIRNHPEEYGMRPDGDPSGGREGRLRAGPVRRGGRRAGVHRAAGAAHTGVLASHRRAGGLQRRDRVDFAAPLTQADGHGDVSDRSGGCDLCDGYGCSAVSVPSGLPGRPSAQAAAHSLSAVPAIVGDSASRAERERDHLFALRVRHRIRHRFRRAHAAHHGDTGRVLRAAGVRDDHGSVRSFR